MDSNDRNLILAFTSKFKIKTYCFCRLQFMLMTSVYVDYLLIFTNNSSSLAELKNGLTEAFEMIDLGETICCIGLCITINTKKGERKFCVNRRKFILDISRFGMADCKSSNAHPNLELTKNMSPKNSVEMDEIKDVPYREAVGALLYLSQETRPDIIYAVHVSTIDAVSKFNNNPGKAHYISVKDNFPVLKGNNIG